jgi:hypothetical protein
VADDEPTLALSDEFRRAVFRALVEAQDQGLGVGSSRPDVAHLYRVTDDVVRAVEREGLDAQWPPLGDDPTG